MPKMLCVKCEVELRPEKNEVYVKELFMQNRAVYKIWMADLWQCPICRLQVVSGFANKPVAEHFQDTFPALLKMIEDTGQVVFTDAEVRP